MLSNRLETLREVARERWFSPEEVEDLLRNHELYGLSVSTNPVEYPPSKLAFSLLRKINIYLIPIHLLFICFYMFNLGGTFVIYPSKIKGRSIKTIDGFPFLNAPFHRLEESSYPFYPCPSLHCLFLSCIF